MAENIHTTSNKELMESLEFHPATADIRDSVNLVIPKHILPEFKKLANFYNISLQDFILKGFYEYFEIFLSEPDTFTDFFLNLTPIKKIAAYLDNHSNNENFPSEDNKSSQNNVSLSLQISSKILDMLKPLTERMDYNISKFIFFGFKQNLEDYFKNPELFFDQISTEHVDLPDLIEIVRETRLEITRGSFISK